MALKPPVVAEVQRLLGERELSQRAIAVRCKVSRGSVANIRKDLARYAAREDLEEREKMPTVWCVGCGCHVSLPCIACRDRRELQHARHPQGKETDHTADLVLKLPEGSRGTYEEIRQQKRAAGEIDQTAGQWKEPSEAA